MIYTYVLDITWYRVG